MAANDYVQLEEIKHTLELSNLSYADEDLKLAITTASRGIDDYCGRQFFTGGTAEVRYYTASHAAYQPIDDLVSLGTLQTDYDGDGVYETTWTQGTDFLLEPQNASAYSKPYDTIRVLYPRTSLRLPMYAGAIKVTGQFGWAAAPAAVKQATIIMATRFLRRGRDAPFGVVGVGFDNAAVRIPSVDPDVRFMLEPYQRGGGVMVA
jgi:hypothetical protein